MVTGVPAAGGPLFPPVMGTGAPDGSTPSRGPKQETQGHVNLLSNHGRHYLIPGPAHQHTAAMNGSTQPLQNKCPSTSELLPASLHNGASGSTHQPSPSPSARTSNTGLFFLSKAQPPQPKKISNFAQNFRDSFP